MLRDHLHYKTTFGCTMGWSLKTDFTGSPSYRPYCVLSSCSGIVITIFVWCWKLHGHKRPLMPKLPYENQQRRDGEERASVLGYGFGPWCLFTPRRLRSHCATNTSADFPCHSLCTTQQETHGCTVAQWTIAPCVRIKKP